ncbi:efflux RND transporter periplasmic adaptor subunit [Vitiosangium sp. GDMCC 1.1324]|uniref:efflux RND transporter periplasmic adaptor subunit n=1 Tax=Vitiosangium sp. (strain GDMCC 1.1324) TaxID=2138576 RepID=UPI000D363156|nr:efflux RND transporter periplasmic adaptor subunit [Vitiosangium sp. GDMCC 1.1324]PTL76229.1 hypothetical protein DAT35_50180 [Vitiosangium sp. GDMCC 1.1324]
MRKPRLTKILLVVAGIAAVLVLVLQMRRPAESAEPATPKPVTDSSRETHAEGRVMTYPGALVTVGTEVAGRLEEVRVDEKQTVRKGEVVAVLDSSEERAALGESRALAAEAAAQLRLATAELARYEPLQAAGVATKQTLDRYRSDREVALARLEVAQARVRQLESRISRSRILSPINGVVISRVAQPGESVAEQTPLLTIADLSRLRVEAEVDEYDAGRVVLGAPVRIEAEGYPGKSWRGVIEEIPDAVGGRYLKPDEPGRPVDTRVLRVKVALAEPTPLKLEQRVDVTFPPASSDAPEAAASAEK